MRAGFIGATREDWDEVVAVWPNANFLNSWQWGEIHEKLGDKIYRLIIRGENTTGAVLAIVKDARRGRYLEVPGGPLIDWGNKLMVASTLEELRLIAKADGCVFIRIRPQEYDSESIEVELTKLGFKKALMHLYAEHTSILDLTSTEEKLLSNMRQQTRYEIKRASKEGIEVTSSSSPSDLNLFYEIQVSTAKRQGFVPSTRRLLELQLETLGDNFKIYRAEKNGQMLSMAIIISYGREADYYEGASTEAGRKLPGACAIQWRAIQDAKQAGIERYNFWGIASSDNPKHRFAGVTTFKRGFGGEDVSFVPAHDLVLNKIKYVKNWLVELVRKKMRNL